MKYFLYIIIIFIIAMTLNYFKVISIPWLDTPFSTEEKAIDSKKIHDAAKEALGDK